MPTITIEYATESERLQYERVIAYVQELNRVAGAAPHGTVLDRCECVALDQGRAAIRDSLQSALQARADLEKKVPQAAPGKPKGRKRATS